MKNILIINGHQRYEGIAEGNLTKSVIGEISSFLKINNFEVRYSVVDSEYDVNEELSKFAWADCIIFQFPVYWMSLPWMAKKYVDDVFSCGFGTVTYQNDGRSSTDESKKYGSGGLMVGKSYMLSLTYNCPKSEFSSKDGFFEGLSLDEANYAVHKIFQFCGAKPLETYAIFDVYKGDMDLVCELKNLNTTLKKNFK
jgi:NADPH dehydrogenase (quinone)